MEQTNSQAVPKTIHYVWVGGNKPTPLMHRCLASWKRFAPEYTVRLWNEENIPMNHPYVTAMYAKGKWAFVSDYVRFWVLEREGGIYLDTDMELLQPIDPLLAGGAFVGRSKSGNIESSVIAAPAHHPLARAALNFYDTDVLFSTEMTSPRVLTQVLSKEVIQHVRIFGPEYFYPCDAGELCGDSALAGAYARHHWAESWVPFAGIRKVLRAVRLMPIIKYAQRSLIRRRANTSFRPFVSIALTTFNGGELIREQIESILTQTYTNFELVISDDGSDLETQQILDEYAKKDSRVRWSRSPLERGYVKNTENAIALCKGEIIFLCDQDDTWYPEKIALHVKEYQDPRVSWVYNRLVLTDATGSETGYIEDTLPDYYRHKTMLENAWGTCIGGAQTSYRASLLKRTMPVGLYAPAHDSWIQLALNPRRGTFINRVLQTYRQHGNNEVGFGKTLTPEQLAEQEARAIRENMRYLKHLPMNRTIALWKRVFFLCVYVAKVMRAEVRKILRVTRLA